MGNMLPVANNHIPPVHQPAQLRRQQAIEVNLRNRHLILLHTRLVMEKILPHLSTETTLALAYSSAFLTRNVYACTKRESFCIRFNYMARTREAEGEETSRWLARLHMNKAGKVYRYGANSPTIPAPALSSCSVVIVDSHYARLSFGNGIIGFVPSKRFPNVFWTPLCATRDVRHVYFISVNINENELAEHAVRMEYLELKTVHLENVQSDIGERRCINPGYQFIQGLYVPPMLVQTLVSQPQVSTIKFVSLYINEDVIVALEQSLDDEKLTVVKTVHIEDVMMEQEHIERMNAIVLRIKENQWFETLVISLHQGQFGFSLLSHILENKIKFRCIGLIINMRDASQSLFEKITELQKLCNSIKLTFHRTWRERYHPVIDNGMKKEMIKWQKVIEVTLGKVVYPYIKSDEREIKNTQTYIDYIKNLGLIPNLRSFGFKEQVNVEVVQTLTEILKQSKFEEITLALSEPLARNTFNMEVYNTLLEAVPVGVKRLRLLYFPMNEESLSILSRHKYSLEHLLYFQLTLQKVTENQVDKVLPKVEKNMKNWMSTDLGLAKMNTCSNWLINRF